MLFMDSEKVSSDISHYYIKLKYFYADAVVHSVLFIPTYLFNIIMYFALFYYVRKLLFYHSVT